MLGTARQSGSDAAHKDRDALKPVGRDPMKIRVEQDIGHRLGVLSWHAQALKAVSGQRQQSIDLDYEIALLGPSLTFSHYTAALDGSIFRWRRSGTRFLGFVMPAAMLLTREQKGIVLGLALSPPSEQGRFISQRFRARRRHL
jgi:hypothetical protein